MCEHVCTLALESPDCVLIDRYVLDCHCIHIVCALISLVHYYCLMNILCTLVLCGQWLQYSLCVHVDVYKCQVL